MVELRKHPSKMINIGGKEVEIDSELAPLIDELNKIGLKTTYCCIGGDDFDTLKRAYISFDRESIWVDHNQSGVMIRWIPTKSVPVKKMGFLGRCWLTIKESFRVVFGGK